MKLWNKKLTKSNKEEILVFDDYDYIDEENWDLAESDWEYFKETAEELFSQSDYILSGSLGLWNGSVSINACLVTSFQDFLDRLTIDSVEAKILGDGHIELINIHHDGRNYYELIPIEHYTKDEIKDILYDIDRNELNEVSKELFDKSFSQLTKSELLELLPEFIETL